MLDQTKAVRYIDEMKGRSSTHQSAEPSDEQAKQYIKEMKGQPSSYSLIETTMEGEITNVVVEDQPLQENFDNAVESVAESEGVLIPPELQQIVAREELSKEKETFSPRTQDLENNVGNSEKGNSYKNLDAILPYEAKKIKKAVYVILVVITIGIGTLITILLATTRGTSSTDGELPTITPQPTPQPQAVPQQKQNECIEGSSQKVEKLYESGLDAIRKGIVLEPPEQSAKFYLDSIRRECPNHPLSQELETAMVAFYLTQGELFEKKGYMSQACYWYNRAIIVGGSNELVISKMKRINCN